MFYLLSYHRCYLLPDVSVLRTLGCRFSNFLKEFSGTLSPRPKTNVTDFGFLSWQPLLPCTGFCISQLLLR